MNSLNWVGAIALIIGFGCFGLIGFKRSAWWGPAKSLMDELDLAEKRFVKIGFISLLASLVFFVVANI
jgi:hypothetical protein